MWSGDIYVTCHNDTREGEIRVLGLDGKVKRRIGVHTDWSYMFGCPSHVAVNSSAKKIFVSGFIKNIVACMSVDGSVIYAYKDDSMR